MRDLKSLQTLTATSAVSGRGDQTLENLKVWLRLATPEERAKLAAAAGTSVVYLYQLSAHEGAAHKRGASAALASRIERAAASLTKAAKGRLPELLRTDLCQACRDCEYAQRCLGARAVASDFKILTDDNSNA